ncbi:hypothetical protein K1719_001635 [Acacia pycnantha]|nr:hypothetical protein K1719_001635 [Acacia pycnantha]
MTPPAKLITGFSATQPEGSSSSLHLPNLGIRYSECAIPADNRDSIPIVKQAPIMAEVVIGIRGTIKKWTTHKKLSAVRLNLFVFDEADQMVAEVILAL